MALILRIDVDKPYGRSTSFEKIKSKITEDYYFPKLNFLGYLKATEEFITYCNSVSVVGIFYFRNCTAPNKRIIDLLNKGGHKIGFHAENTRDFDSFKEELEQFKHKVGKIDLHSFTKHGSGDIKIGRNRYPPYEPQKYIEWAKDVGVDFPFGNENCKLKEDFLNVDNFYPKMFWIHKDYRGGNLETVEDVLDVASYSNVPVIIHPSNFIAEDYVNSDFKKLVTLAAKNSIQWEV